MKAVKNSSLTLMLTLILLFFIPGTGWSQHFFASLFAGGSNYSGDLQEKRFTLSQAHPAAGLGLLYEFGPHVLVQGEFAFGRISADDKLGKNAKRNLNFYSHLYEFSLKGEYMILDPYYWKVSPYVFAGVAVFDFAPYTDDAAGNPILLPEKSTEGQGFIEGRSEYKLRQLSIPFGGGFQWSISDNSRLGIFVGFRKTFTDYIDDVSTTYVDQTQLALAKGQVAANIAYRGDELPNGLPYPPAGTQRGNPKSLDWYYFTGLSYRVRLFGYSKRQLKTGWDGRYTGKKGQTGCPKF